MMFGLFKKKPAAAEAEQATEQAEPTEEAEQATATEQAAAEPTAAIAPPSSQVTKTQRGFFTRLKQILGAGDQSFAALKDKMEEELLLADFGVAMTTKILSEWQAQAAAIGDEQEAVRMLAEILEAVLLPLEQKLKIQTADKPFCLLVMGVNGSGKTTSLAKLARYYQRQGFKLHLAAGDTYRAAAREQLQHWGAQLGIAVTTGHETTAAPAANSAAAQGPAAPAMSSAVNPETAPAANPAATQTPPPAKPKTLESAAVIYQGMQAAMANNSDIYLMDTAGRMPNNEPLRQQLRKAIGVVEKLKPGKPDEIMLVLDATHGQSALLQAKQFCEAVPVSGLLLTKLDGEAKGGVIFALAEELKLPIRFIGVGEKSSDLMEFDARQYVKELLSL